MGLFSSWLPWRKREEEAQNFRDKLATVIQWEREAEAAGWREWRFFPPPKTIGVVEIKRREWHTISFIDPTEMAPWVNVAGLYWRAPRGPVVEVGPVIEVDGPSSGLR